MCLMTSDGSDPGCQGYLQLSVTVLGPGDVAPVHDIEKGEGIIDTRHSNIC